MAVESVHGKATMIIRCVSGLFLLNYIILYVFQIGLMMLLYHASLCFYLDYANALCVDDDVIYEHCELFFEIFFHCASLWYLKCLMRYYDFVTLVI